MSKISLILTNDWELHGDGSGSFEDLQGRPLRELLAVCETHGAKLTVMAEAGQQLAYRHLASTETWADEIAASWDTSLKDTVRRGHDVQLHLHSTWVHAKYQKKNFELEMANWTLASLSEKEIRQTLGEAKHYLDLLLRPVQESYRVLAFRAGDFCIQPAKKTLPILKELGFRCDTSVVPGFTDHLFCDFRGLRVVEPGAYALSLETLYPRSWSGCELIELPVHTKSIVESPLLKKVSRLVFRQQRDSKFEEWSRIRTERLERIYPIHQRPFAQERRQWTLQRLRSALIRRSAQILDYDYLAPDHFCHLVELAAEESKRETCELVAIGHAKNIPSTDNLDRILSKLKSRLGLDLEFKTIQRSIEDIDSAVAVSQSR